MSRIKLALEVVNSLRNLADSIEDLVRVVEANTPEPKIEQATRRKTSNIRRSKTLPCNAFPKRKASRG